MIYIKALLYINKLKMNESNTAIHFSFKIHIAN